MNKKRVAIVTGGTRGIGKGISIELAKNGDIVLAVYKSSEESALNFQNQIKEISPESKTIKADVSKKADVNKIVEYTASNFGRIDILVNNAGVFDFAFLEEDCDLSVYMKALVAFHGKENVRFKFVTQHSNRSSKIRNYPSFFIF